MRPGERRGTRDFVRFSPCAARLSSHPRGRTLEKESNLEKIERKKRMDRLMKCMSHVDMVKISVVETTELVEEARKIHGLNPTPTAALGRLLTMGTLMGTMMKNETDKLTLQILGDGPAHQLLVSADCLGHVKGCISNPLAEAPLKENGKLNVSGIIGRGSLNVIKDVGLKEPYVGSVPLQTS